WNELPHRLKDSNLRQADDIWKKLNLIGCAIGLAITTKEPPFVFTPEEIELLAQAEHERWMDERTKKGWKYSPVRNDQERAHDCLIPWEKLPQTQREKDRNAIRTLPEILAKVHLRIIRLKKG
ncbi:MAG: ryanodine receptor Ryr, partial [Methanomicrobiales archaeon]|nr:ryanodine receptor Ryr [Methanomicrobiales archaeon]